MPMLPRSCFLKGGVLGRPRQWDVEIKVKTDQSIELFILVKGVAGVTHATAKEMQKMETDWQSWAKRHQLV